MWKKIKRSFAVGSLSDEAATDADRFHRFTRSLHHLKSHNSNFSSHFLQNVFFFFFAPECLSHKHERRDATTFSRVPNLRCEVFKTQKRNISLQFLSPEDIHV